VEFVQRIEHALVHAEWSTVFAEAAAWVEAAGPDGDPRAYFALNVVHLIRGEFASAWKTHAY
jgi:hypothetical protein